jgi:hypothetical protein
MPQEHAMSIKYQVDGNIFREINEKWLCANISEYLIKARGIETDSAGNEIENYLLNDGRMFSKVLTGQQASNVMGESKSHLQPARRVVPGLGTQSMTQPR